MKKVVVPCTLIISGLIVVCLFLICKQDNVTYFHASWAESYSNFDDLVDESEIIAVVDVQDITEKYYLLDSNIPFTEFKAEVVYAVKGVQKKEVITILQTGMSNKESTFEIKDDPLIQIGTEYLIFGARNEDGTIRVLGGPQGRYVYNDGTISSLAYNSKNKKLFSRDANYSVSEEYSWIESNLLINNVDAEVFLEQLKNQTKD